MAPEGLKNDDAFILMRRPGNYEMSQKQHSTPSMRYMYETPGNKTMGSM